MRIAICDDSEDDLALASRFAKSYLERTNLQADIEEFSHPDALLTACEKAPFDLYLLDIVMPMISGIDVAKEIRRLQTGAQLVFLTTSDEFAVDAFALNAAHYLVKPFTQIQIDDALSRAIRLSHSKRSKFLVIKTTGGGLRYVDIGDILYVESRDHRQTIHVQGEDIVEARRSLTRILQELEAVEKGRFIAPYKGYIVNMSAISSIDPRAITLKNDVSVPLPRGAFRELRTKYADYRFGARGA